MIATLAACWCHVVRTRVRLRRYRGARLQTLVAPVAGRDDAAARAVAETIATAVRRAGARVPGSRCLDRAITLVERLRARGIAARLAIGVRRRDDLPRAHAWVELAGVPVGEDAAALAGFAPLADASSAPPSPGFGA